jgi:ATP-dependent DNA helicase PIF1
MAALEQTARTGKPPDPEPRSQPSTAMQPLHEQLLASLELENSKGRMPSTYVPSLPKPESAGIDGPGVTPAAPPGPLPLASVQPVDPKAVYFDPEVSLGARRRAARFPSRSMRKGTIEEVLGEGDPRASDASVLHDRDPQQVIASKIDELDRQERREDFRSLSAGEKALRLEDEERARLEAHRLRVEEALAREAAGEQVLPLEEVGDEQVESAVAVDSVRSGDAVLSSSDSHDPVRSALSYDLPTDPYQLPAFCFVCGPAGVGKTFQAKAWSAFDPEGIVLAATTGIAAVNLGEGTTINALLRFYNTRSLEDAFTGGWLEAQLKRLRGAGLRRIVLDEVSMLAADQLTILCRALDNVNGDRGGDDPEMGLILTGDFAQLPPVPDKDQPKGSQTLFAFESPEWARYHQATYGLTTIRRQADARFIEALQSVRRGDHAAALDYFGSMLEPVTNPHFQGTTILAKNDAVGKYNQLRLDKVQGAAIQFPSQRWGKLRSEWGGDPKPRAEWGVPETLHLKEGALVMILANRAWPRSKLDPNEPPSYIYVNGDLGTVQSAEAGRVKVLLQRTGDVVDVVPITRENVIPLEVGRRKALKDEGHPERISENGKHEIIGACSYMPIRLAYASTVHKSQGLSLDNVQVNIRDHFFATPGMLYVALSRARTAQGLRLVGTHEAFRARCTVSPKVRPWII